MRRSFLALCLSLSLVLLHISPAAACINDRDTFRTEREFRTNYEFKSSDDEQKSMFETPAPESTRPAWTGAALTWSGFGLALLACGLVGYNLRGIGRS